MRIFACLLMLSCAAPVVAQSASPGLSVQDPGKFFTRKQMMEREAAQTKAPMPTEAEVPSDTPIVTLQGICETPRTTKAAKAKVCKTILTRGEMDGLTELLMPEASPVVRRQFAIRYARLLAGSVIAEQRHLDKDPAVIQAMQAHLKFERMQVLTGALYTQLEQRAANQSTADIQKYYDAHTADFELAEVLKLSLPKAAPTESGQPLDAAAVNAKAEQMRTRIVAGEDIEQLQQQAYKDLGIKTLPPPTKIPPSRRSNLTREEQAVFDLKADEVTPVLDSNNELLILKLVSKHKIPVELAREEIASTLLRPELVKKGLQDASNGITAEFNLKYLQLASAPELFLPPLPTRPGARQGVKPDARARVMASRRVAPTPITQQPAVAPTQHQ